MASITNFSPDALITPISDMSLQPRKSPSGRWMRVIASAKELGKGLVELEKKGIRGIFVGGGQEKRHPNLIREILLRNLCRWHVDCLAKAYKHNDSHLPLVEWVAEGIKKYGSVEKFIPVATKEGWEGREKKARKLDESEIDPELSLPIWRLRQKSKAGTDESAFQTWRSTFLASRKAIHAKFIAASGVHLSFEEFEKLDFKNYRYSTRDHSCRWILEQLYEKSGSPYSFSTYVRNLKWQQESASGKTTASFEEWNTAQDATIFARYEKTRSDLPYDTWRRQQDDTILDTPAQYVRLKNAHERKNYVTTCENGILMRKGFLLDTQCEKTATNGLGTAMFVIGPDDTLYTGSHVSGVSHHPSFVDEGAVQAAGEVKTNDKGEIVELHNKSGHYQPTTLDNLRMLRYFKNRGVDLTKVTFTTYSLRGRLGTVNAAEYYQKNTSITK